MISGDLEDLIDIDNDGDFDALDYAVMEEVEKDARKKGGGDNSGCCVVLLAPVAGIAAIASSYFII